ncbi:LysM peptidoglycan-binding domain-containing protein [Pseudonocardia sp.]|uniref:LysM peptidoglycan-binding domain-containing protein n=1 Tax=Pseudonocardia sp. TaxID=60912 RepID=UPI0026033963|nr:LysM peptidoglycan-binding domain-containing protein [Pseudonocardia sp.]
MSTLSRVASAVAAAAATAGILVGVPIALWLLSSSLLDPGLPAGVSIIDLLLAPDSGTLLIGFLTVVAAGTWLVLAMSIVVELAAALVDRPALRIDLPGFRLGHAVAAALVTAMLGAGPAMATPIRAEPILTASMADPEPARAVAEEPSGPVHTVQRRDTLWRIAETSLGDPLRWREIYALNADRIQDDGGRLTEASELVVGWRLVLPSDAQPAVRVQAGDTLTGIAEDHLGDPARSDELLATNLALPQPDGGALVDPDVIRPGWTLVLPDRTPPPADDPVPAEEPVATTAVPTPDPPSSGAPTSDPLQRTNPAIETPAGSPATPVDTVEHGQDSALTVTALGVSALVAGGVVTSLAVRRRRQQRLRLARHRIPVPADDDGRVEWSLSTPQIGPVSAARHLDLALRSLTHPDRETDDSPAPVLISARLTPSDALLSTSTETRLPPPFITAGPGGWGLDADDPLPVPDAEAAGCCAPFPALVSIATDGDRTLMIDLEQRGVLRIGGDRARCVALLRHLAAELATSSTAEDVEVLLVGLGDGLVTLGPDRLTTVSDLDTALTEIEHRASTTRDALDQWQVETAVDGRLCGVAADSWLPTVLLAAAESDDEQRARLDALAAVSGRSAIAAVVVDPGHVDLRIGDDTLLHVPDIADGPWEVAQLTKRAGTHLAAVLGPTMAPALPVGVAQSDEPWATGMNEDGTLGDPLPPDPLPDAEPLPAAGPAAVRRLAIVDHQDPDLDDDLTVWHADGPPTTPRIGILGEPTVTAPGPDPTTRRSWFAEVLVYLSLHPAGVTPAKAVTDLWPDGHRISPATLRHAFYSARKWAGRGYSGDPDASFVSDMQHDSSYRLRGHLLDWDLFRRLRKRGQARHEAHHPGAITDYEAALNLVRGPVLSSPRPGGYAWLNNHDQRHDLQKPGFIVDAAHELVDIALDTGDTRTARWAAERARAVDIDVAFDRPLTDLMRIAHAEDNRSELELYAAVLLDARGFDVPEELAPDSFAVLNELLPAGPRRPRR